MAIKNIVAAGLATVAAVAIGAPAFAGGTGVTNSTTSRISTGNGYVRFSQSEVGTRSRYTYSQSVKAEAAGDDWNYANASTGYYYYNNGYGSASSSDYGDNAVAIVTKTTLSEYENSRFAKVAYGGENYNFIEVQTSHTVDSFSF